MKLYCLHLLVCLIRLAKPDNNSTVQNMPLILNGHYISWPSSKIREKFIYEKKFIPKNIIYTRFQVCSDRVFLAAPRYKRGVPFTLSYTKFTHKEKCYNYVSPFPCIENEDVMIGASDSGSSLINAIDLKMGCDSTLWVLDAGISDTLSDHPTRICEPKIVGFDIFTKKVTHTITLSTLICRAKSRLQYLAVEQVTDSMTVLYVSDGGTRSIIVWYVEKNEGYKIKLPHSIVDGCSENPIEDVFYMMLIEQEAGNYIYFTYLSSQDIFRTRTKDLQKRMNSKCIVNMGKKPCKMVFLGVGYGSVLYFRIKGQNHLYSWDTKQSFLEENFMVVRKSRDCRLITHVDVDSEGVLWVLESNIQDFIIDHVGCYGPSIMLTPVFENPVPVMNDLDDTENFSPSE
ncbi:protein yellow-like [Aphis craccivora]|uniref:Protein yellow-like n=1 Tax=Aphis craccivora TaxID=307492 RepID=A0A6G0ZB89_APHCR|nr:protein yellow-like [Aphis craccivora]